MLRASQLPLVVKSTPTNAEDISDAGSIPGSGKSPGVCGSSCFFCLPSDGGRKEVCVSFLMGGAGSGKNWVLLW